MQLEGKTAIVTGGARGIGRQIAVAFARAGANIILTDIDGETGEEAISIVRRENPRAVFVQMDITGDALVAPFFQQVKHEFGALDILVNNAGATRPIEFFEVTRKDFDWIFGVNTRAVFFMMQAAAAEMKARGDGRIINIASIAGKGYRQTSNVAYAAAKGAVISMTRIAAAQLGKFGITVNSICPGVTETEMVANFIDKRSAAAGISKEAMRNTLAAEIALGRLNSVDDIASAALFLASSHARNITGQSLNVDGGLMWD
jgi:NAD(P)-dependent dehydrogenase (short-subunit alcohol dehydrogenase family)